MLRQGESHSPLAGVSLFKEPPGFAIVQLLFPALSGAVGGGAGGILGRMMSSKAKAG